MYSLIYLSSATKLLSSEELVEMLRGGRERNAKRGITGMLVYKGGNFLQVLEGEKAVVEELFAKIEKDPRHKGLLVLLRIEQPERAFAEHTMGFQNLDGSEVHKIPGYSEFLNTPLTGREFAENPTRAQKLLLSFKKHTR